MPRKKTPEEKRQEKIDADLKQMLEKHKQEIAESANEMEETEEPKQDNSMGQFFQTMMDFLKEATKAVKSARSQYEVTERKLKETTNALTDHDELAKAVGFKHAGGVKRGTWRTPRVNPCWHCGQLPTLQKAKYGDGWLVICEQCFTRSEDAEGPMQAIQNWNEQKETETSRLLNRPLSEI